MITWIASYPRSGNTVIRLILKEVFGLRTKSKYNDDKSVPWYDRMVELLGQERLEAGWPDALPQLRESVEEHFVKTHDGPETDDKCIYIVREPCATAVSYWHFLRDIQCLDVSLIAVATGISVPYGSWSDHFRSWNPLHRPRTLLVRFEYLLKDYVVFIARLADFLERRPIGTWQGDITRLRAAVSPVFFRSGSNDANQAEMPPAVRRVLESVCWREMNQLGYPFSYAGEEDKQVLESLVAVARKDAAYWRAIALNRQAEIERLADTCRERQELIDRLDGVCRERQAIIEELDEECRRQREAAKALASGDQVPRVK